MVNFHSFHFHTQERLKTKDTHYADFSINPAGASVTFVHFILLPFINIFYPGVRNAG